MNYYKIYHLDWKPQLKHIFPPHTIQEDMIFLFFVFSTKEMPSIYSNESPMKYLLMDVYDFKYIRYNCYNIHKD